MRDIHDVSGRESQDEGAPWFDYAFDIADARVTEQDRLRILARAGVHGEVAGFGLEFERGQWDRDQVYSDIWFDHGRGALFSTGTESDVLARFLSQELGNGRGLRFVDRIETDVVMLNSLPDAMLTEECRTKFFFGDDDATEAQVFVNFDIPKGLVELKEKDLEYRASFLAQLVIH